MNWLQLFFLCLKAGGIPTYAVLQSIIITISIDLNMFFFSIFHIENNRPSSIPVDGHQAESHRLDLHTYPNNQTIKESKFHFIRKKSAEK